MMVKLNVTGALYVIRIFFKGLFFLLITKYRKNLEVALNYVIFKLCQWNPEP